MASSKLDEAIGYYNDSEIILAQAKTLVDLTITNKENNNDNTIESINRKED